ncbi:hypothetical protein VAR608DRAFT_5696 [Variovorax sp. HW608]|nr:hypothetical protein VAR608DRAFT_5696 [Variovorax sp. HW608]
MTTIKRASSLAGYTAVLPYASEMFGVYQPLIGWKSRRRLDWIRLEAVAAMNGLLSTLAGDFQNRAPIQFNQDCNISAEGLVPAELAGPRLVNQDSMVLREVALSLAERGEYPPAEITWRELITRDALTRILRDTVVPYYTQLSISNCRRIAALPPLHESQEELQIRRAALVADSQAQITRQIEREAAIAGVISQLVSDHRYAQLNQIFFADLDRDAKADFFRAIEQAQQRLGDPYLAFDPKGDVKNVTLSPVGIVHLFRQYFFELDTFLGTPTGHVWLSPGATVELIEVSTRKTTTERAVEISTEQIQKVETSTTDQDELSEAVKQDNKEDLKLGFTSTINQSWGTGNISATPSLNMDKTQEVGRETTHKRMRQQTEKLSTEIRQNYKSTFKTVTEVTDTSSKRYVLSNTTDKLINYELRRKMRQVGVQVQDIGSYLCWETFIDEPGEDLGLASLIHIAKPADLLPIPDQSEVPYPADRPIAFQTSVAWDYGDSEKYGFVHVGLMDPPPAPEGLEVVRDPNMVQVIQVSGSGEDFTGTWAFGGRWTAGGQLEIGVLTDNSGLSWNKRVDFVVGGSLRYIASAAKKAEIDAANNAKKAAGQAATLENDRKTREAFVNAAKERIEMAGSLTKRKFEDLRDEERIIVYRRLITSLMTAAQYKNADNPSRHILSQLINSIFDVDKMLYFVAPEWWKPRERAREFVSLQQLQSQISDSLVAWSDSRPRPDNYLVTDKSTPAPMGSSLGWLLQLDGDDLRNAFLNAPWVRAVIPIRPGKEEAAIHWLQSVNVEGSDGLDALYEAPADELDQIRAGLGLAPGAGITIGDAIHFLCKEVAAKNAESNQVKTYPATEINVDSKVSSTPVEKVYEHGFYPLQGGFRVSPNDPSPDPNNTDKNFQVFDQWIEILPTDQVVPVEVTYDPKTGRQL